MHISPHPTSASLQLTPNWGLGPQYHPGTFRRYTDSYGEVTSVSEKRYLAPRRQSRRFMGDAAVHPLWYLRLVS